MPRALLSVSDKTGLPRFATRLVELGYELVSTGGTYTALADAGLPVSKVSDVTGQPEILDGRVKTLHPRIHGGILARADEHHERELAEHGIQRFDLVAVNLYPFRQTVARSGTTFEEALETIDIGGPAMIRAAAKNHPNVIVVVDPTSYDEVLERIAGGSLDGDLRRALAARAFAHTAAYDAAITRYLAPDMQSETALEITLEGELRYGENPHQQASLWRVGGERGPVLDARVLHGKAMSFNNYGDADAAWALLEELPGPAAVAVKHANPCGVAVAPSLEEAYALAHAADPVSVFGGIVALSGTVTAALAEELAKTFLEIVMAPDYDADALEVLRRKKNLRILEVPHLPRERARDLRRVRGGLLVQDVDLGTLQEASLQVVSEREPTEEEWRDLRFAWPVAKHARSNAIVIARGGQTVGIGAGQVSRVWAVEGAVARAGERARGAVLASDAFFPFEDGVRLAAEAGVRAVIQPGGSVRDGEVIAAANESGLAMVFTGMRHFRH